LIYGLINLRDGMGQEISTTHFSQADFQRFERHLQQETGLLASWIAREELSRRPAVGGFELEVWLVDGNCDPVPINEAYLQRLNHEWVSPELSRFNVELNGSPRELHGDALSRMEDELTDTWRQCCRVAEEFDASLVMVGILPSVREQQLVLENMSRMKRYYALNEQVIRLREGRPIRLDIVGREHLQTTHHDVMLESATTSFQVHWQVPQSRAVRAYNASVIASAATVAVSANAPYLFGRDLWDETRIPLFEQAVEIGGFAGAAHGPLRRVSFGSGYVRQSMLELYQENLQHFPILLPMKFEGPEEELPHLRLHNGTIWRWNRPLIGFNDDGTPHMRIEHRVISAGPTIVDGIANAAFYFGLARYLSDLEPAPETRLSFSVARDNFYACARNGLQATVTWFDDCRGSMLQLLQQKLMPAARQGLQSLDMDAAQIDRYMGIIEARVESGQNGSQWQRQYVARHGCDMRALTAAYMKGQESAEPVHTWPI